MRRVAGALVTLAMLVAAWFFLAPRQLGGPVAYVTTQGNSMAPRLDQGDLVIVRRQASYDVGDVVAFRSAELRHTVLHRIIATDGSRFVTKGDNNSWTDSERPSPGEVIGRMWVAIPAGGKVLGSVRPFLLPLLIGVLALTLVPLVRRSRHDPGEERAVAGRSFAGLIPVAVASVAAAGLLASAALGLMSFRPAVSPSRELSFEHRTEFSYKGSSEKNLVYTDGRADTGEPVFLRLIEDLEVAADYSFEAPEEGVIEGRAGLAARLVDPSGWTRRLELSPPRAFTGTKVRVAGTLDLGKLAALTDRVAQQTGVASNVQTITLLPTIDISGTVGGGVVEGRHAPSMDLTLEPLKLVPAPTAEATGKSQFLRTAAGSVTGAGPGTPPSVFGMPAGTVRAVAFAGGLACLVLLGVSGSRALRRRDESASEVSRMAARRGVPVIEAASVAMSSGTSTAEVDFDALLDIAERFQKPILHCSDDGSERYLVDAGNVVYLHRTALSRSEPDDPGTPPGSAPRERLTREPSSWRNSLARARARHREVDQDRDPEAHERMPGSSLN